MSDSWEDSDPNDSGPFKLSSDAKEWVPNASAQEWNPSWLKNEETPPQAPPSSDVESTHAAADDADHPTEQPVLKETENDSAPVLEVPEMNILPKEEPRHDEKEQEERVKPGVKQEKPRESEKSGKDLAEEAAAREAEILKNLPEPDPREHLNVVFIGHVDAGKSTLSGSILYLMGSVDQRTIEKFTKEAKERNRESWFLAFIMDTNEEERAKGKTVEVGRAHFETENKRYTILDAPGHKNYIPAMILGASQADVGILVISARKGEFEAGFDRLGQTREHATLAKTLGVQKLVVVVNKMDEQTVQWSQDRYEKIVKKLTPFLKASGFKVKRDVIFIPISALTGINVKDRVTKQQCEWATQVNGGRSLIETLDRISISGRDPTAPLRIPILDSYIDRGLVVMGKVESGNVRTGQKVLMNPNRLECIVDSVQINEDEVAAALAGENVILRLKGIGEEDVKKGFVLSGMEQPASSCRAFIAHLVIIELLEHRSLFSAGYNCVFHAHTAIEECTITKIGKEVDPETGKAKKGAKAVNFVTKGKQVFCEITLEQAVCVEPHEKMSNLARFTLRDEGKTIAIGKVIKLVPDPE